VLGAYCNDQCPDREGGWGLITQCSLPQGAFGDESKMTSKEASAQGDDLLLVT